MSFLRLIVVLAAAAVGLSGTVPTPARPLVYANGIYPDPVMTPGVVDAACTKEMVCTHGYTVVARNVTEATKKKVFKEYGIDFALHSGYEVDHDVSLELCGSNDLGNLWAEPYAGVPYTARMKDKVENFLKRSVCSGTMTLPAAQAAIASDWVEVYNQCCRQGAKP